MGKLLIGVKCLGDDRCNLLMEFVYNIFVIMKFSFCLFSGNTYDGLMNSNFEIYIWKYFVSNFINKQLHSETKPIPI